MITAQEARQEAEAYLNNRKQIHEVLDEIDNRIRIACHSGLGVISIKMNELRALSNLTVTQIEMLVSELEGYGYNVNPIYETHHEIKMSNKIGYNISW
jgi:hypothetical protein